MKKKTLHQPPAEMREAMALAPEERRRGRNWHAQGSPSKRDFKEEQRISWAKRSSHRVLFPEKYKHLKKLDITG